MKAVLALLIMCMCIGARAEEEEWGVRYTLPEDRSLLEKIIPTREDIPYMESPYFLFEGTNFYPSLWGKGIIQFSVARYYIQWNVPGTRWKLALPELTFSNPGPTSTIAEPTIIRLGFAWRRSF